jgi:hypothetical protein
MNPNSAQRFLEWLASRGRSVGEERSHSNWHSDPSRATESAMQKKRWPRTPLAVRHSQLSGWLSLSSLWEQLSLTKSFLLLFYFEWDGRLDMWSFSTHSKSWVGPVTDKSSQKMKRIWMKILRAGVGWNSPTTFQSPHEFEWNFIVPPFTPESFKSGVGTVNFRFKFWA